MLIEKKPRKERRDKGMRLMTPRDAWVLRWIAEMYAVRFDQLQQLLSRQPSQRNGKVPGPEGLTDSAVDQVIGRWQVLPAWVEYQRIYRDAPGWVQPTPHCERLLDLPYARHNLRESRLMHRFFVNSVRLDVERRHPEYAWVSERTLLSQLPRRERNDVLAHMPDAEVYASGRCIAVEIELSPKLDEEVDAILLELLGGGTPRYRAVWYFVSDKDAVAVNAWKVVEDARTRLPVQLQSRMQIIALDKVKA